MLQYKYQKAIKFAGEVHKAQLVQGSNSNYLLHISNVAMEVLVAYQNNKDFDIDFAVQIAILHDTIEDGVNINYDVIKNEFGEQIAKGVLAVTKNENLKDKKAKMSDSINRILKEPKEVALVKIADRITNLQTPPKTWSTEKINNYYLEAKDLAEKLMGNNDYLDKRINAQINIYEGYCKF
jgi:(p)ppGpp synthase/HD superfamily hydrolase